MIVWLLSLETIICGKFRPVLFSETLLKLIETGLITVADTDAVAVDDGFLSSPYAEEDIKNRNVKLIKLDFIISQVTNLSNYIILTTLMLCNYF